MISDSLKSLALLLAKNRFLFSNVTVAPQMNIIAYLIFYNIIYSFAS